MATSLSFGSVSTTPGTFGSVQTQAPTQPAQPKAPAQSQVASFGQVSTAPGSFGQVQTSIPSSSGSHHSHNSHNNFEPVKSKPIVTPSDVVYSPGGPKSQDTAATMIRGSTVQPQQTQQVKSDELQTWKAPSNPVTLISPLGPIRVDYDREMFKARQWLEEKETSEMRAQIASKEGSWEKEKYRLKSEMFGAASTITYPFRSQESVQGLGIAAGEGALFVGGAMLALSYGSPWLVAGAGIGLGYKYLSEVPKFQDYLYSAKAKGAIPGREAVSEASAETGASLIGGFAAAGAPSAWASLKETMFDIRLEKLEGTNIQIGERKFNVQGPMEDWQKTIISSKYISDVQKNTILERAGAKEVVQWNKNIVSSKPLEDWQNTMLDSNLISQEQKDLIKAKVNGDWQYGIPAMKGKQLQIVPKEFIEQSSSIEIPNKIGGRIGSVKSKIIIEPKLSTELPGPSITEMKAPAKGTQYPLIDELTGKPFWGGEKFVKVEVNGKEILVPNEVGEVPKSKGSFLSKLFISNKHGRIFLVQPQAELQTDVLAGSRLGSDYFETWGWGKGSKLSLEAAESSELEKIWSSKVGIEPWQISLPFLSIRNESIPKLGQRQDPELKPIVDQIIKPIQTPIPDQQVQQIIKTSPIQVPQQKSISQQQNPKPIPLIRINQEERPKDNERPFSGTVFIKLPKFRGVGVGITKTKGAGMFDYINKRHVKSYFDIVMKGSKKSFLGGQV
jgi:hypothetical protein